jgi:hypothetical protein
MAEILLVIVHDAWNRVSRLDLSSHFLQASGEGFDLLLLLRDRAFQLLLLRDRAFQLLHFATRIFHFQLRYEFRS